MDKKEKCSITQKNRIVIHKENIEKRIYIDELDNYINNGWEKGISDIHRSNNSKKHIGKEPWNKNTKGISKPNSTSFKKGQTPWNKGKKGVQVAWNKGLNKTNDSRVLNWSNKLKEAWNNDDRKKAQSIRVKTALTGTHKTQEAKEKYLYKCYKTKKENNSFNTSNVEEVYYIKLCEQYGKENIIRQYRDNRYPYRCDFYIKSEDLFIELNAHWTHGGCIFDENSQECLDKLNIWKEKAKTSKFYAEAIITWTIRDVEKYKCALKNNLNYIVIYNI